jgi:hypothetical protein
LATTTRLNLSKFSIPQDGFKMSTFAAKRKAKVIKVDDEEGSEGSSSSGLDVAGPKEGEHVLLVLRYLC